MNRDEIIESELVTVNRIIDGFVGRNTNFVGVKDDLIQTATIKLIETVDRFLSENRDFDAHFSNYVRISIVTGVSDFIRSNSVICTPKNRWTPCERLKSDPEAAEIHNTPLERGEVLKRLFDITQDQTDAKILQAKMNGAKTAREVAEVVGVSMATVYRRLKVMKNRYKSK